MKYIIGFIFKIIINYEVDYVTKNHNGVYGEEHTSCELPKTTNE